MDRSRLEAILDLDRYPIDRLDSRTGNELVAECRRALERGGMFNLEGLIRAVVIEALVAELLPVLRTAAFTHARRHNIYFRKFVAGLPADHPALAQVDTVNHTICADQIPGSMIVAIYEWPPLAAFLAAVMGKPALHVMADPLARLNVMAYRAGEALNWHFDRSEFTTTLLLQAPEAGGEFEYRTGLRTQDDPNYDGVALLLRGHDPQVRQQPLSAGTLNVFRGTNTAHRVTPVRGQRERIIAVFSYYERPGVMFSTEERQGFFGRAG